jgi:hypothetical protein
MLAVICAGCMAPRESRCAAIMGIICSPRMAVCVPLDIPVL